MEELLSFLGRLHPLIVHLPIGVLVLAFLFETLSWIPKFKSLAVAVPLSLLIGAVTAVLASLTGLLLSEEGGYDDKLLETHKFLGFTTAAFTIILYVVKTSTRLGSSKFAVAILFLLVALLSATGHYGGSLTHGEDFLLVFTDTDPVDKNPFIKISNVPEANLYSDVIQPILQSKCYSCHSSVKQKGGLRLDKTNLIVQGGKHGKIINTSMPDSSRLYTSIILPIEDKRHMPPRQKPHLSSVETDLIHAWIVAGASFDKRIKDYSDSTRIAVFIKRLQAEAIPKQSWLPIQPIGEGDKVAIERLKNAGAIVTEVEEGTQYLAVNLVNAKDISPAEFALLQKLGDNLIWLNASIANVNDGYMKTIGELRNLRYLSLAGSSISDNGLKHVASNFNLQHLNLTGTNVTNVGLKSLGRLENLKELYLYQTKVTREGLSGLVVSGKEIKIDTGKYTLPVLASDTIVYKQKQ